MRLKKHRGRWKEYTYAPKARYISTLSRLSLTFIQPKIEDVVSVIVLT